MMMMLMLMISLIIMPYTMNVKYKLMYSVMMFYYMIFIIMFFSEFYSFMNMKIIYHQLLNLDNLSYLLIMLSLWILLLMLLSKDNNKNNSNKMYLNIHNVLILLLSLTFLVNDYLMFYLCFESILIPIFMLILGWGYQPERIQAGLYIMLYTLFASLPLLMSLFLFMSYFNSLFINYLVFMNLFYLGYNWLIIMWMVVTMFAFLVKMPIYMFHLWLPKAHVEAPLVGSMLLAGVLLKLGGYGIIRMIFLFKCMYINMSYYFICFIMMGGIYSALVCMNQTDLKMLIAYSSVAHMSVMTSGLMTLSYLGIQGGIMLMLGHGLCSSGLFFIGNIMYERFNTRSMLIIKGLSNLSYLLNVLWFIMLVNNISAPPCMNLFSEINLFISLLKWSFLMFILLILYMFICSCYTLYLYYMTSHGKINLAYSFNNNSLRELVVVLLHLVPLNLYIMKSEIFYFIY
uniref:NADH-ubiquinone oxidoreductase chain 4 n=1 Tax=Colossendeis brevirostris TaxID=619823 RepID=A0A9E7V4S2_9CHEL|nr:NADH dehydrogenase subunit 4 [Colossendeis brevirostris]UYX57810.1 NADH dehydrogenase subunit 4 [Colossendeis brevirostris]